MINWTLQLLVLTFYTCYLQYPTESWKITHEEKLCQDDLVVHWFKATNATNLVYYIFAADKHVRPPAVIMIHSPFVGAKLSVNCTAYIKNDTFRNSITVEEATTSYGLMLYQICDYLDFNNSAIIPDNAECHRYFGSNLKWDLVETEKLDESELSITFAGTQFNESHDKFLDGGSIEITFSVFEADHIYHYPIYYEIAAGAAMKVTVAVKNLKPEYPITRVSPVLFLYSNQSMEDDDDFVVRSGYPYRAPDGSDGSQMSSYLILNERVKAGRVEDGEPPAFIQFPPISTVRMEPDSDVANAYRSAGLGPRKLIVHKGRAHKFSNSIVYAYYGNRFNQIHQGSHVGHVGARIQFINLGNPGDGFYKETNYISWSCVLSLGSPHMKPLESGTNVYVWAGLLTVGVLLLGSITAAALWYRRRYVRWSTPNHEMDQCNLPNVPTFRVTFLRKAIGQTSAQRDDRLLIEPLLSASLDSYNTTQHSEYL